MITGLAWAHQTTIDLAGQVPAHSSRMQARNLVSLKGSGYNLPRGHGGETIEVQSTLGDPAIPADRPVRRG